MSDAWEQIQALKAQRESRRKRLEERKKCQDFLNRGLGVGESSGAGSSPTSSPRVKVEGGTGKDFFGF